MAKYIIETDGNTADDISGYLGIRIEICNKRTWVKTDMELTPYTEPDLDAIRKEAHDKGYETAKHECEQCRKVRADAEQELAEKAYQRGLNDAWEAARKIVDCTIPYKALENYLEVGECTADVIKHLHASKAIEVVRQYEQEKEDDHDREKVVALADDIGIHKLYALVREIRGE